MNLKIDKLREQLKTYNLDAFLIPSNDEFQSEYVPDYANNLKSLIGFTGSNGELLITYNAIVFFTDGRYLLQAKQELLTNIKILDIANIHDNEFISGNIGFDPKLYTKSQISRYLNCNLIPCDNLISLEAKPKPSEIFNYKLKYAGESSIQKLQTLQTYLKQNNLDAIIITDSAIICWLLNVRAHDVACNPILLSYAIYHNDGKFELFSNHKDSLPLTDFSKHLKLLENKKIQLDPDSASIWVSNHFKSPIYKQDPCIIAKACKNKTEINQAKRIHVIDGSALTKLLYWLDKNPLMTELSLAEKLLEFRSKHPDFLYPSFPTIAGFASNGAIIHYQPKENTNKPLTGDGLLLLDSGGQYFGGTTDITRVIPIGKPTYEQKHNFTLVLKGHIALATAIFPQGTSGGNLDILARQFLLKEGKDYAHGTGHGVGSCLSVHEGPQRISHFSCQALKEGMILSNEPGYYKNGEYGIRIENLMLVVKLANGNLGFETLSLAPIDKRLILTKLLSKEEKNWLNKYHAKIYKKLSPNLNNQEANWLSHKTQAI